MGRWSRDELEGAFQHYLAMAEVGARTDDWSPFAECFTEDCFYKEHLIGDMSGRDAVKAFYDRSMVEEYPGNCIAEFPVEWYIIDDERGWVVFQAWSCMEDPGDGSVHREYNFSLVKYAGDGRFSYQEDIYNPMEFATMIANWEAARAAWSDEEDG